MIQTVAAPAIFRTVPVPAGALVSLAMPDKRIKGIDFVGTGGALVIPDGRNAGSGPISVKGRCSKVLLDGIRMDLPRNMIVGAGIGLWGEAEEVMIRRSRITGVNGGQKTRHGDGMQVGDQAEIDTLVIEDTTICSAYQALIAHRTPNGKGLKTLWLRNVNVRDEPDLRVQMSIALLLGDKAKPWTGPKNAPYRIILENVWVDWPSRDHAVQFPDGAEVIGAISRCDYVGARRTVNGTDKAETIAGYARAFETALIADAVPAMVARPRPAAVPPQMASTAPSKPAPTGGLSSAPSPQPGFWARVFGAVRTNMAKGA